MGTSQETVFEYNGSLASLTAGGILDASLINTGAGAFPATITDGDGILSQSDDFISTFSLQDGSILDQPIDYIGSGTVSTISLLGITIDTRPVTAFSVNGQIYLIAPEGFPILSSVSISFDIDPNAPYTLSSFVPCLVEGTLILTPEGYAPIETLKPGREVLDPYGATHTVLWHGTRQVLSVGKDAQIKIRRNFFGPGVPFLPTCVLQQHRIVVYFPESGGDLKFVRAKLLLEEGLILKETPTFVIYHHLLFAKHIIMLANGMPTESLLAARGTRKAFGEKAWNEIAEAMCSDPDSIEMELCLPELRRGEVTRRYNQRNKLLSRL